MDVLEQMKKKLWKEENTSEEWKTKNLKQIITRMKGWQLETFKESYNYKRIQGISLFKKNLLEKNNYRSLFIESISLK